MYWVGDALDTTGLVLTYTDAYGVPSEITEGFTCTPTTLNTAGTQAVTVTYQGLSATFNVTVKALLNKTLTVKTAPDKTEYWVGDTLDTTGLVLTYTDAYGVPSEITEGFTCTPTTLNTAGTQTVTVTYQGLSATFNVTVKALLAPTLTIQTPPAKTEYLTGDMLDTTGLVLTYTDDHGAAVEVVGGYTCSPASLDAAGTISVTVTYGGASTVFDVTVSKKPIDPDDPTAPAFALSGASGRRGETVDVTVSMENNPGIVATRLFFDYDPAVLHLDGITNGTIFSDDTMTAGNDLNHVPYVVFWVDSLSPTNNDANGVLLTLHFTIAEDAPKGDTTITLRYDEGSTYNVDLTDQAFLTRSSAVTVVTRMPGDANEDGLIDLRDTAVIRRYLAGGWPDNPINLSNADVNADDSVDLKDVALILRYLAGGWNVKLV